MKLIQAKTFSTLVLSLCAAAASTNEEDSSSSGIHVLGFRIPSPKRILTILHFEWEEEAPAVELVVPVESIDEEKLAEVLEEELKLIEEELELVETIDDEKRARAFEEELLPQVDPQEDVSLLIKNTTIAKLPKISHTSSRTSMKPAMTPEKKSNTNTKAKYKKKTTVYKKSGISKKNEAAASTIEKVKANRKKTKQKSQDSATSKLDGNSQHDEGGKLRKKKKKTAKAAATKTRKTPKYVKGMKHERALVDAVADDLSKTKLSTMPPTTMPKRSLRIQPPILPIAGMPNAGGLILLLRTRTDLIHTHPTTAKVLSRIHTRMDRIHIHRHIRMVDLIHLHLTRQGLVTHMVATEDIATEVRVRRVRRVMDIILMEVIGVTEVTPVDLPRPAVPIRLAVPRQPHQLLIDVPPLNTTVVLCQLIELILPMVRMVITMVMVMVLVTIPEWVLEMDTIMGEEVVVVTIMVEEVAVVVTTQIMEPETAVVWVIRTMELMVD